jgi:hypothetical protein
MTPARGTVSVRSYEYHSNPIPIRTMMINQERTVELVIKKRCRLLKDAASSTVGGGFTARKEKSWVVRASARVAAHRPPLAMSPKLVLLHHRQ